MSAYYKKYCISQEKKGKIKKQDKIHFQISTILQFVYNNGETGYVKAYSNINVLIPPSTFYMAKTVGQVQPSTDEAYPGGKVPIKKAKIQDLLKVSEFT